MSYPMQALVLDTMAAHLRRCAVLIDDPPSVDTLITCARTLDDRAEELRAEARSQLTPTSRCTCTHDASRHDLSGKCHDCSCIRFGAP